MAPRNIIGWSVAGSSSESTAEDRIEIVAAQQAKIERLTALLAVAEARDGCIPENMPTTAETMAMLTESIVCAVGRLSSTLEPRQLVKIPSLATLTDGQYLTFESWKIQVQDKLKINLDHFSIEDIHKAFVFACTGGDAQSHL